MNIQNKPTRIECCGCMFGCFVTAKSSINVTYARKAEAAGPVDIRTRSMVREITVKQNFYETKRCNNFVRGWTIEVNNGWKRIFWTQRVPERFGNPRGVLHHIIWVPAGWANIPKHLSLIPGAVHI